MEHEEKDDELRKKTRTFTRRMIGTRKRRNRKKLQTIRGGKRSGRANKGGNESEGEREKGMR